jgi:transitional endoplasmic reticulum ATPase
MKIESTHLPPSTLRFKVTPADTLQTDARLGLATAQGLKTGDIITITGQRQTVARLTLAAEVTAGCVQLSPSLLSNAGVEPDETVLIAKVQLPPADRVVLNLCQTHQAAQLDKASIWKKWAQFFSGGEQSITTPPSFNQRSLLGEPLHTGDQITHAGSVFHVMSTQPEGMVIINEATQITLLDASHQGGISYLDVGGLDAEVARVREMVELPLRCPQVFQRLGIDPPKGVLLYGPPGCGKTLIARAVAHEAGAYFINVNGPEIIQKHYGESEALLRNLFIEAQKHPASIIFFDEIDAIAPNRETVLGDMEKRVVAQLLALMDGLNSRGQIVVIAATNLPNNVDPALRRPGRFDREIGISPPDKHGRLEVLQIHTRTMPLAYDVDLKKIAAQTHGFLGADLAALCREAAMICARTLPPAFAESGQISSSVLRRIFVKMTHFEQALNEIELSTTRQVSTDISDSHWGDIGGLDDIKQLLQEAIEWPLKYADRFEYAHTSAPRGILLTGVSGTGKTLLAKTAATQSGVNFISVQGPQLLSKWVGESERGIREVFKKARQSAPCILFFDELDAIVPTRGRGDSGGNVSERMVGQFLLEMDNLETINGVIVLAATNRPDLIDHALLRPGRFEYVIELPLPDDRTRRAILEIHCRARNLASDVDLSIWAKATQGLSGADLEALCRQAALQAIKQSITDTHGKEFVPFAIHHRHFVTALGSMPLIGHKQPQ